MSFSQGHALVIGVGAYGKEPSLNVPIVVSDAQAVAEVLRDDDLCGYPEKQVRLLKNEEVTKAGLLEALDVLRDSLAAADTLFLFYCGHGALGTDGRYYLVTHDAQINAKGRVVDDSGVSEDELREKMRQIKADRALMVFNTCYSGAISPTLEGGPVALSAAPPTEEMSSKLLATGQGRIIITACREDQFSYVGDGKLTIFSQALVDGLRGKGVRNSGGFISVFGLYEVLYEVVSETVSDKYHRQQEPELTVLKGRGPFAVSLCKGATTLGQVDEQEPAPQGMAVREVKPEKASRLLQQSIIQFGGVNFGQANEIRFGGDLVARDKITVNVGVPNVRPVKE